jgi:hypothetical protein
MEFSSVISDALGSGSAHRTPAPTPSSRKRNADTAGFGGALQSGALITPVTLMPAGSNPLLNDNEEDEFTCLDGDEQAAVLHDRFMQDEDKGCVYCEHGMCKHELSRAELDQIHALEEEHYGTMSDKSMYNWISEEYKQKIKDPLTLQKAVRDKRLGVTTTEEIPDWPPEGVAKHFEKDGLYMHRMIGDDLRFTQILQNNLRYHGIAKKRKTGGKDLDADRIKTWRELSKHKSELITRMHMLYPKIAKRQDKSSAEGAKPSGTRA